MEAQGVRAIHASEEELASGDAGTLLESAIEDECLLVTRNYADFTDLATAFRHAGRDFPGILFAPAESAGGQSHSWLAVEIARWVNGVGVEAARNACTWLDAPEPGSRR